MLISIIVLFDFACQGEGEQHRCALLIVQIVLIAAPPLIRLLLQQWHSRYSFQQQIHEQRTDQANALPTLQRPRCEQSCSCPQYDLSYVIGMPRIAPQSAADEFVLICRIAVKARLLSISNDFNGHSDSPYANSKQFEEGEFSAFRYGLGGEESEKRTHGDDDPQSLNEPRVQEAYFGLFYLYKPAVHLSMADAPEKECAQSARPRYDHEGSNCLFQLNVWIGECCDESDGDEGQAASQVIMFLCVVDHCRNESDHLDQQ